MGKTIHINCKTVSPVSEICWNCANFDGENPSKKQCSAFPTGIPRQIWNGENDHREPYPGDNGTRFQPIQIRRAA